MIGLFWNISKELTRLRPFKIEGHESTESLNSLDGPMPSDDLSDISHRWFVDEFLDQVRESSDMRYSSQVTLTMHSSGSTYRIRSERKDTGGRSTKTVSANLLQSVTIASQFVIIGDN